MKSYLLIVHLWLWTSLAYGQIREVPLEPEMATGSFRQQLVNSSKMMVVTPNTDASKTALAILKKGGTAVDAAIAAAIMLTLTEPNASGIGGGGFLIHYNAATQKLSAYDGRETAPAQVDPKQFLLANGNAMPFVEARVSGKAVGTPGLLRLLELSHQQHGKLPWTDLVQPTIDLANTGFLPSTRLQQLIRQDPHLRNNPAAKLYFFDSQGQPHPPQYQLKNLKLAKVLSDIAMSGSQAFYSGPLAHQIISAVQNDVLPGSLQLSDLSNYQVKTREIFCGKYQSWKICGMPPPSSGTITILQILALLEQKNIHQYQPNSWQTIHLFSEAGKLAYADRDAYIADPDFIRIPSKELLEQTYIQNRSQLIQMNQSLPKAVAGKPANLQTQYAPDQLTEEFGTSHLSIIDQQGNQVSLTTTIESQFGSRIMVEGFFLNNQLTDFSFQPNLAGLPIANRIEANKRPRSSMAPLIILNESGQAVMTIGSAGGSNIINFVAKTLLGLFHWNLNIQEAIALPNFGNRNQETELEVSGFWKDIAPELEKRGHQIKYVDYPSGTQGIMKSPTPILRENTALSRFQNNQLFGAADPRRLGLAIGE